MGGRIKTVLASEGQRIAAGEPLLILEAGDLDAQRLMAQGQLEEAQANLDKLVRGARPEDMVEGESQGWLRLPELRVAESGR